MAVTIASSTYDFDENTLVKATEKLNKPEINEIKVIILDRIGYTYRMKQIVLNHTDINVVLSRNIVFRNAAKLF